MKDDRLPTSAREPAQNIDETAAVWTARLDRGLTNQERAALDQWLAGDSRRIGALARARAIWTHADRVRSLGPVATLVPPEPSFWERIDRRTAMLGGGAVAASLVAGITIPHLLARSHRIATATGEIRRVPLGEGSVVTLDTDSVVETAFSKERRDIRLLAGVAFFEVAHDPSRPFVVEARDLLVRAVGTAFSIRNIPGQPVSVVVSEGQVALSRTSGHDGAAPLRIGANTQAIVAPESRLTAEDIMRPLTPDDLTRSLSWRDGMLSFEGETLAQAARRFRRYGGPAIVIDDAALARQPISGLFAASDPRGFAQAIAISFDAHVDEGHGEVRLTTARPR